MRVSGSYSAAQKWLHWTMAVLIVLTIPLGISLTRFEGSWMDALYELHKSVGLVLLSLAAIRIAVRTRRGAPPLVEGLPAWQRAAAYLSHYALYVLIVMVPVTGWAATSIGYPPVRLFWTIPVTLPFAHDEALSERVYAVHNVLAFTLAGIVAVHVLAALHHHFGRRDRTLLRMWPGTGDQGRAG
jgi:cytochrome b561